MNGTRAVKTLLLEIGVEELPASFVNRALAELPELVAQELSSLRVEHEAIRALGTPRRLAVVGRVAERQRDLDEQLLGPPARVAFDAEGRPTKAALSFAEKAGVSVDALFSAETPKGTYVAALRRERGRPAVELLPEALGAVCTKLAFQKSMRWADGEATFGRPVRWLVALFGTELLPVRCFGLEATRSSRGHRFLAPEPIAIDDPATYVETLRSRHVLLDPAERRDKMLKELRRCAEAAGGTLIEDEALVSENASLVEEPHVILGSFEDRFLGLPERVILDVAKGHQFYFGVRGPDGKLLPRYLAVAGTAEKPENVRRGNDRVMRARLSDAQFFFEEDLKHPLEARLPKLDGIVFHKLLGTVGDKVRRLGLLIPRLAASLGLGPSATQAALAGANLAKCDLACLMVGEFPELQGEMGRVYALRQGVEPEVASVIAEHYLPRGAEDALPESDAGALVALADRLDTLTGCFAVGLVPKGTADPLALRRAAIAALRILIGRGYDVSIAAAVLAALSEFRALKLEFDAEATVEKVSTFLRDRMRGVLPEPTDVVDACLAVGHDRPYDVALRVRALAAIDASVREIAGEVFKRAANIMKDASDGAFQNPLDLDRDAHPSERRLFEEFERLRAQLTELEAEQDYRAALGAIAGFAPVVGRFFDDVFVMVDDARIRDNRLRLMRAIHDECSRIANFKLLAAAPSA